MIRNNNKIYKYLPKINIITVILVTILLINKLISNNTFNLLITQETIDK